MPAEYEYKYSFIPRRCHISSRWVWGTAIRERTVRRDDMQFYFVDRWLHKDEAVMMMLKETK